jgi:peptidoglycan-associated lipoprotein
MKWIRLHPDPKGPKLSVRRAAPACLLAAAAACGHAGNQPNPVTPSPGVTSMQPAGTPTSAPAPTSTPDPPNTPTAANVQISEDILRACNLPDADAYFEFDSSKLTELDAGALGSLATCFTAGPLQGRRMSLVGHADPRGGADYNMTLGQARADAVAEYLAQRGVQRGVMDTTSRGAMDATGRDETGWAHDRRVDVLLAAQ